MPPPHTTTSVSTISTSGSSIAVLPSRRGVDGGQRVDAEPDVLPAQRLRAEVLVARVAHVAVGLDRAPWGRADRELEALDVAVAELDRPHDRVGAAHRGDPRAHRHHVGVAAHLDRALRARLDARVALPA